MIIDVTAFRWNSVRNSEPAGGSYADAGPDHDCWDHCATLSVFTPNAIATRSSRSRLPCLCAFVPFIRRMIVEGWILRVGSISPAARARALADGKSVKGFTNPALIIAVAQGSPGVQVPCSAMTHIVSYAMGDCQLRDSTEHCVSNLDDLKDHY